MKRALLILTALAVLLCAMLIPSAVISEGESVVLLAKTMYTLAREQSDDVMLAIGGVVMNRVASPWFPDTVAGVIEQPHQFAYGTRYDDRALRLARAAFAGQGGLRGDVLYYRALDASEGWDVRMAYEVIGNFGFFTEPVVG